MKKRIFIILLLIITISSIFLHFKYSKTIEYYENGKIKSESFLKQNKLQTIVYTYYPNENLKYKAECSDDKLNGKQIFYYENKKIKGEFFRVNNLLAGKAIFYYKNGKIKSTRYFKNNNRDSLWQYYNDTTYDISSYGYYKNNFKIGKWIYYNINGKDSLIWEKYEIKKYKIGLNIPNNWKISQDIDNKAYLIATENYKDTTDFYTETAYLFIENRDFLNQEEINNYINSEFDKDYKEGLNQNNISATEIKNGKFLINNKEYFWKNYSLNTEGVKYKSLIFLITTFKEINITFAFYSTQSDYNKYEYIFFEMVNSLDYINNNDTPTTNKHNAR